MCVCVCVCVHAYMAVCLCSFFIAYLFYFERCKSFGLGHVPVAMVLFGGLIYSEWQKKQQNGGKDNHAINICVGVCGCVCVCTCVCVYFINKFIYILIAEQVDC